MKPLIHINVCTAILNSAIYASGDGLMSFQFNLAYFFGYAPWDRWEGNLYGNCVSCSKVRGQLLQAVFSILVVAWGAPRFISRNWAGKRPASMRSGGRYALLGGGPQEPA
jgi:hypothetical protein